MRLLLDTNVLLHALGNPETLSDAARAALSDEATEVFVSAASFWEVAIKRALGKLDAPPTLIAPAEEAGFALLPITAAHAERAGALPPVHRDPFDRMLVAQALEEGCVLVTMDEALASCPVAVLRA